jgi:hypothetical protein
VLGEAEQRSFTDRHRADLACPVVHISEDPLVDRLEMGEVIPAREWMPVQPCDPDMGDVGFGSGELFRTGDAKPVS